MSTQLCSVRTLNALATFAQVSRIQAQLNNGDFIDATHNPQAVADILLNANLAALRINYPTEPRWQVDHELTFQRVPVDAISALKLAQFYNYQCCEDNSYDSSDAANIMRRVLAAAIRALPGYDIAPWGFNDDTPTPVKAKPKADVMALVFPNGLLDSIADATEAAPTPAPVAMAPRPIPKQTPKPGQPKPTPKDNDQPNGPF